MYISGLTGKSGKTTVCTALAATMQSLSYSVGVYKPMQLGAVEYNGFLSSPDLAFIKKSDENIKIMSSYLMKGLKSPMESAFYENITINLNDIISDYNSILSKTDCTIIEGSNSISSPILPNFTELDMVEALKVPLILVLNPKDTPIDYVICAIKYIQTKNIDLRGLIINKSDEFSEICGENYYLQILKDYFNVEILGCLPEYEDCRKILPEQLISDALNYMDIEKIFNLNIEKLSK